MHTLSNSWKIESLEFYYSNALKLKLIHRLDKQHLNVLLGKHSTFKFFKILEW